MEDQAPTPPGVTVEQFTAILDRYMPQVAKSGITVVEIRHGFCRVRVDPGGDDLRAGGTLSGPTMFALADLALYGAVLSVIGPVPLAVTSTITINFLRKPAPKPLLGEARIIRTGKRLSYGEVFILSVGEEDPVAHATGSYAIPAIR